MPPEPGTLRFPIDGVYTVTLTVSGLGGTNTVTHARYITTYEPVRADFSASPVTGTTPLTVAFTNRSTGAYDTCTWDFGDGNTSKECDDPIYAYQNGGRLHYCPHSYRIGWHSHSYSLYHCL